MIQSNVKLNRQIIEKPYYEQTSRKKETSKVIQWCKAIAGLLGPKQKSRYRQAPNFWEMLMVQLITSLVCQ